MDPRRFLYAALLASCLVWYLNVYRHPPPSSSQINARSHLVVQEGKLHILVTGGAGFIASHAVLLLLEQGHAVTVVDNLSRGNMGALMQLSSVHPPSKFKFFLVDLGNSEEMKTVLLRAEPRPDLVMHFAAIAYVGESVANPLQYYSNVTVNTINLVSAMKAARVDKLVYSSTCAVYGDQPKLPITEESTPMPNTPYGESKLMAEQVIRAHAKASPGFQAIILRYFNVYGSDPEGRLGEFPRPELRQHARISGACMDAALGLLPHLTIKGTRHPTKDGTCIRDYIHVTDLVGAHVAAMSAVANPPALYNVGTGRGVSVREFVSACKKVTGVTIKVVEQAEARPGDYAEVWADPAKINRELGWRAKYTNVEQGLAHAWAWRQTHPQGY